MRLLTQMPSMTLAVIRTLVVAQELVSAQRRRRKVAEA